MVEYKSVLYELRLTLATKPHISANQWQSIIFRSETTGITHFCIVIVILHMFILSTMLRNSQL